MINRLLPETADNTYLGHPIARWLLTFYVVKSFVAGSIHMFASDGGAQSIASITLGDFSQGASDTVVTIFGLWGLEQFVIGLIGAVILWRYKALIPVMALAYAIEYFGRFAAQWYTPGVTAENEPPGAVLDTVLVPLAFVMFGLSLWRSKEESGALPVNSQNSPSGA